MYLDTNISLMPHLSSAVEHLAPLTVMFYMVQWVLDAITSRLCIVLMAMRFSFVAVWYTTNLPLTSTYCRKTTRFYASYARITYLLLYAYRLYPPSLHQYPTYKRKASGKAGWIGFIFNSARWVNRPASMINTAVAIT